MQSERDNRRRDRPRLFAETLRFPSVSGISPQGLRAHLYTGCGVIAHNNPTIPVWRFWPPPSLRSISTPPTSAARREILGGRRRRRGKEKNFPLQRNTSCGFTSCFLPQQFLFFFNLITRGAKFTASTNPAGSGENPDISSRWSSTISPPARLCVRRNSRRRHMWSPREPTAFFLSALTHFTFFFFFTLTIQKNAAASWTAYFYRWDIEVPVKDLRKIPPSVPD